VERPGEEERFKPYAALGNQQLLWHGSRLTNWMGILSQVRSLSAETTLTARSREPINQIASFSLRVFVLRRLKPPRPVTCSEKEVRTSSQLHSRRRRRR
jgi:hypothetical protein